LPEPTDPREPLLTERRRAINQQLDLVRQQEVQQSSSADIARRLRLDLKALTARVGQLQAEKERIKSEASQKKTAVRLVNMSTEELQARSKKLADDVERLRKLPRPSKELRYRTPISAPVTEEVMFECRAGRVTLIDTGAMLAEVRREVRSKADELKKNWQLTELTTPVGSFRLRYVIERERGPLEGPASGAPPPEGAYRYGVTSWEVVPIAEVRGETVEAALASGSAFRKVIDALDAQQTAVTLWVYPDSFPLYRALRDHMHEKKLVVAGRPLPEGIAIASSRHGSSSRGQ
jgi:uncharacterized small protein (DUF1192 family)